MIAATNISRRRLDFDGQTRNLRGMDDRRRRRRQGRRCPFVGPAVLRAEYLYEGMPTATYNLNGPALRTNVANHYARVALISTIGDKWRASPELSPADWAGFYFGVIGGATGQRVITKGLGRHDEILGGRRDRRHLFRAQLDVRRTMLGVRGRHDAAPTYQAMARSPAPPRPDYRDFLESDFRGRAGYAIGRFLPFVAAGVAFGSSQQIDNMHRRRSRAICRRSPGPPASASTIW